MKFGILDWRKKTNEINPHMRGYGLTGEGFWTQNITGLSCISPGLSCAPSTHQGCTGDTQRFRDDWALEAPHQNPVRVEMLHQNTKLTETVKALTERIETLTLEMHKAVVESQTA
jgi:hypothetical protein